MDSKRIHSVSQYVSAFAAYADLFQKTLDPVFLLEIELFSVLDCNVASERLCGQDRDEMMGQSICEWIAPEDRAEFNRLLMRAKETKRPQAGSFHCQSQDGDRAILDISLCALSLSNHMEVLQVIGRDVTAAVELRHQSERYLAQLEEANAHLRRLSMTDELTDIANFRHFHELLARYHASSQRHGRPYSVIFADLDHFKNYNDLNGHPAGDEALKIVAKVFKEASRSTDLAARYGGEEFVMLCSDTDHTGALIVANRIRELLAKKEIFNSAAQPLGKMSLSMGIATYPLTATTAAEVIEQADQAAYASKRDGRDRITSYIAHSRPVKKTA